MSRYVVFVVEDEDAWEHLDEAGRQEVYDADARFVDLLARRGGKVLAAAELAPSRDGWWLEAAGGAARRTEGPYAESVEQLGGFYVVEVPDEADLVEACGQMAGAHVRLEVRPVPG